VATDVLMGRVTAGLLFRPSPALREKGLPHHVKRWILQAIRLIGVRAVTILPFSVEPQFARIAASWIYDPQFWDLCTPGAVPLTWGEGALAQEVRTSAGLGRES
jgi:hypothetical protein